MRVWVVYFFQQASNTRSDEVIEHYYLYDDNTKIIYWGPELPENWQSLIFLGVSNNPKPAMAAAVFLKDGKVNEGFRLRKIIL